MTATSSKLRAHTQPPPPVQGVFVLPPRQGRHSLLGIESAFASLRSQHSQFAFEIYGQDGLISYFVRAHNYPALSGILAACYPQAQLATPEDYRGHDGAVAVDWLHTSPNEALYLLPLHLKREPYLPLRFYTDQSLAKGETDPLASVLGYLSAASMDGRRIGARLLVKPAPSLDFVHLGGAGEDVGELSVNCGWGFSTVGVEPRQLNSSVGQPQHEVRRFGHVSKFCAKSSQQVGPKLATPTPAAQGPSGPDRPADAATAATTASHDEAATRKTSPRT